VGEKALIETADGYTVANVCSLCGKTLYDIGYVSKGEDIALYKSSDKATSYTSAELEAGFSKAEGTTLFTNDGVISSSGVPYWVCFDLDVKALPKLQEGDNEADLSNTDSRAYKGWSLLCMVINGAYIAPLRLIPDGWEADSGANATSKGATDGVSTVKFYGNPYRTANTAFDLKEGDKLCVEARFDPSTGSYDVYVDGAFAGSGKMAVQSTDKNSHIRLWEYNGNSYGAELAFTNVKVFTEVYEEAVHTHSLRELIHFFDNGFNKYMVCDCGYRTITENGGFASAVVSKISHVYNGNEAFSLKSDNYWFVTDINVRGKVGDGSLIKLATTEVLKIKDGKIMSGNTALAKVTYPTSYQVAIKITDGSNYDLYFNGAKVASGTKPTGSASTYRVYVGDASFGHHVRFLYNRAVTLGDNDSLAAITYVYDTSAKLCYHEGGDKPQYKFVKETNGVVSHSYICTKCGERVYAKLTNSLVSLDNDTLFGYKKDSLKKADLDSVIMTGAKSLYLPDGVISKNAAPYWITFNLTPKTLPTLDGLDLLDPNGYARRGYNLVSAEASFYPTSELRVVPTETGAEIRILDQSIDANYSNYDTAIATLEVNKKTNVTLYVIPSTGEFSAYINGEYKGTATSAALNDYNPKIYFHDAGAGEYLFSDIAVATEAKNLADSVNAFEFEASFTADKNNPEGYTSLASISRTTANAAYTYDFIFVNNRTGELCFKDVAGNFQVLCDSKGNAHKLSKESTSVVAVYDDVKATVRYYVNGTVPYYNKTNAMNIAVSPEFAGAAAISDKFETNADIVTKAKIHGMEASGTMQIIALQQKITDDSLRIVSGLDIPWYGAAGYKITLYDESGKALGKEVKCEGNAIYNEIHADDVMVPSTKFGYAYFVPIEIKDYTDLKKYEGCYFEITPYTVIGSNVLEGQQVKITITSSGYTFN
jgi:hypothetical protein